MPKLKAPEKVMVRAKQRLPVLTAYQVQAREVLQIRGRAVQAFPLDWIVTNGDQTLDVAAPDQFEQLFDRLADTEKLQIEDQDRSALAATLGFGSTNTSKDLTRAVARLAKLTIGDIKVEFSPAQWEEIARRAEKRRLSPAAYMKLIVERLTQDLWTSAE